jgi:hypothetical protein
LLVELGPVAVWVVRPRSSFDIVDKLPGRGAQSAPGAAVAYHVEVAIMLKPLVFPAPALAMLVAVSSCGSPDRPATSESIVITPSALGGSAGATPSEASRVCEPRSNRECTVTYRDDHGQLHCPAQLQICSVDGTEWLACGMFVYDENHDPQPHP